MTFDDETRDTLRDVHDHLLRLWQAREAERPPRSPRLGMPGWSNPHEPFLRAMRDVLDLAPLDTSGRTWG